VRPAGGFELAAWFFMRVSGLLLVFLAVGHLLIMHVFNNIENVNYAFVARRWTDPKLGAIWRLWDLALISLAVIHGANGLRQVLDEYIARPGRKVLSHTLIWTSAAALIGIGTYAIVMFQADEDYLRRFEQTNPGHPAAAGTASGGATDEVPASPAPGVALSRAS
jgi:succinate dehydrogenase / fumarate reductase membrane anchor subunit